MAQFWSIFKPNNKKGSLLLSASSIVGFNECNLTKFYRQAELFLFYFWLFTFSILLLLSKSFLKMTWLTPQESDEERVTQRGGDASL